jgi:hypothetical protein
MFTAEVKAKCANANFESLQHVCYEFFQKRYSSTQKNSQSVVCPPEWLMPNLGLLE